ncbi:leukotriene A-4 hydrol [Tuber magnatum]|uniref:Leukotriene A(4) hydrolase n=1 Tax=Tuber magnatum TaxID=42249 RepID=A0A317SU53_9PEZI|nr:leukotriene A-4 hydrol [Tuber magnatum]
MALSKDPNTLSNHLEFSTAHTAISLTLSFSKSSLYGEVELTLKALADGLKQVVLDTSFLDIKAVAVNGKGAKWIVGDRVEPYGSPLKIDLGKTVNSQDEVIVKVTWGTTEKCTALQWMTPEQTSNKRHPYMFSQCQAIHARSLYPSQDTPSIKSTFDFSIRSPLPVCASGLPTGVRHFVPATSSSEPGTLVYTFRQPIPMPSYLMAIASGDIANAAAGPRSLVYAGPEELLRCKKELEDDVETFIKTAESLIYAYEWTTYNVLILPPSFPYGGMENPCITFATPTIISGDKSNVDVIAHELSHSWSGNLVSNASWEHFWLNEGWTTYIERRIQGKVHGDKHFHFSAIIGWKAFKESVELFGADHEFTKLVIDLKGKDPDDAFSSVPYEKGFNFLYYLDRLVGRGKWDTFIPHYFSTYRRKSLTSFDFKDTLLSFFSKDAEASVALAKVDWDTWFYKPGLPKKPDFDTTLADACYALAGSWQALNSSNSFFKPSPSDISGWTSGQIVVFLERITDFPTPLRKGLIKLMRDEYGFLKSENAEILSRFLTVGLKAKDETLYSKTAEVLGGWGRMKFVRPLYRLLNECDRKLALETFEKNKGFYHPICRGVVMKDLGIN